MAESLGWRFRGWRLGLLLSLVMSGCASSTPGPSQLPLVTTSALPVSATTAVTPSRSPSTAAAPTAAATPEPVPDAAGSTFLEPADAHSDLDLGITCDGAIGEGDVVAIADIDRSEEQRLALRDYADVGNPRTVCTFDVRPTALIDARHVVVEHCGDGEPCVLVIVDLPEVRYHWYRAPGPWDFRAELVAISPGLDSVAWISNDEQYTVRRLHVADASGDHVVADLAEAGGRCGTPDDSNIGAYTRDGSHLFVLDQPLPQLNRLFVAEGHDLRFSLVPPTGSWENDYPAMALWSPTSATLFYRQGDEVMRWTATSGVDTFLPDVRWTSPTITPDGKHLAYAAPTSTGHDVYLMDPAAPGSQRRIATARGAPVFVNDRQLWYVSESSSDCIAGSEPKRLVYDIETGKEAASILDSIAFVWPGTSATR